MESLINLLLEFTRDTGYWGVFFLMTVESSFIPFPSELVVPPAAYLAQQGEMNIYFVLGSALAGSLAGALINYYLALFLGKPLFYRLVNKRFAKYLLLSEAKLHRAEQFFIRNGRLSTFVGRLIPGVRQLISLPAGFVQMPIVPFILYTLLGAGIWTIFLGFKGYLIGMYKDFLIVNFYGLLLGVIFATVFVYAIFSYVKKSRNKVG